MARPHMQYAATVLDSANPQALSEFYAKLLGWTVTTSEPGWVKVQPPTGRPGLSFQLEENYVPPVWPGESGEQLMMMHLDIVVDDLDAAVAWAVEAGARQAEFQPQQDVRVMLDPAGHPFCLFTDPA